MIRPATCNTNCFIINFGRVELTVGIYITHFGSDNGQTGTSKTSLGTPFRDKKKGLVYNKKCIYEECFKLFLFLTNCIL